MDMETYDFDDHLRELDSLAQMLDALMIEALGPEHSWTASYTIDNPLSPQGAYVFSGAQVQQIAEVRESLNSILMFFEENKHRLEVE